MIKKLKIKSWLGVAIFGFVAASLIVSPGLALGDNNKNDKSLDWKNLKEFTLDLSDLIRETPKPQETVRLLPNSDARLTGVALQSINSNLLTVRVFGINFSVDVSGSKFFLSGGPAGALTDFKVGDILSVEGKINNTTGIIAASKITNHSISQNTSNLQKRIQELLALVQKLQDELKRRLGQTSDVTAPSISSVGISNIASTGATINWLTNESAKSKVYYSTISPVNLASASAAADDNLVTNHNLNLSGLSGNTTYYFVVESADASNNIARSGQSSFATAAAALSQISNVSTTNILSTGATVNWQTNIAASSQVFYSLTSPVDIATAPSVIDNTLVTSHTVNLAGLTASSTYYFVTQSKDALNNVVSSTASFTTAQ